MIVGGRWLGFILASINANTGMTVLSLLLAGAAGCLACRLN